MPSERPEAAEDGGEAPEPEEAIFDRVLGSERDKAMGWLYTTRERFTPESPTWNDYLAFSGFKHIAELVTLDVVMCPNVISDLTDEDWEHNVHEDFRIMFFRDVEYLMRRQPMPSSQLQILAVLERPDGTEIVPPDFHQMRLRHCRRARKQQRFDQLRPDPRSVRPVDRQRVRTHCRSRNGGRSSGPAAAIGA